MKRTLSVMVLVLGAVIIFIGAVLTILTVSEYRPDDIEELAIAGSSKIHPSIGQQIRIMSWNLGYGGLGDNADFFMDGGKMVYTASKERIRENLDREIEAIDRISPDIFFAQEIDIASSRSYMTDEIRYLSENSASQVFEGQSAYAPNYKVGYVPVPIPPIGKVDAGIATFSRYEMQSSERVSLPCPFKWPLKIINLKRCLEVSRLPVDGSDKELVLVNLHLEAYDNGEGKIAQTRMLKDILLEEVEKGNYVIVGGDFNQIFSNINSKFPVDESLWQPGVINVSDFGDDMLLLMDEDVASCRSLDRPLADAKSREPSDFQYYIIDGFMVSNNIEVKNMHTEDLSFISSDHNPVIMDFVLK